MKKTKELEVFTFDEEEKILIPAIEESSKRFPYLISGPYPADTVLVRAIRKQLDGIVYLYHDQVISR